MAPRKSERLVNLTIALLAARRYVPKEDLRRTIEGYRDLSDAAFDRTFERDKDELRSLGVPLETGSNSVLHDDEVGYRISRRDFELPPLDLTPAEATAVALAARMWTEATMAEHTRSALVKLGASGAEPDALRLAALAPADGSGLTPAGPGFDVLWQAVRDHQRVTFVYRGGERRRLEPWIVTFRRGAWYVVGFDLDRGEERMFRTSRIEGDVALLGAPGAFVPPDEATARAAARRLDVDAVPSTAVVALRPRRGGELRHRATPLPGGQGEPEGFDVVELAYTSTTRDAADLAALGEDAHVLAPAELRDAVVAHLQGVLS